MADELDRLRRRVDALEQAVEQLTGTGPSPQPALEPSDGGGGDPSDAGTANTDSPADGAADSRQPAAPVDASAESIDAESLHASGSLTRNRPTNLDTLGASDGVAAFRSGDTNYTLVLQIADDSYSPDDGGYAATVQYVTASGERIATTSADRAHNHWGVYTRGSAFDGVDRQPEKRLSIGGGSAVVQTHWQKVDAINLKPMGDGHDAMFRAIPEAGNDAGFTMYQGTGNLAGSVFYDASRGNVRIQNYAAATADFFELKGSGEVDTHGHPQENFVTESGSTSDRPSSPEHAQQYFDDDLGRPTWFDGNVESWVDASGSTV